MSAEPTTIYHRPVGCALAGSFPLLEARFAPAAEVAAARVFFQTPGAPWFSVKMKPEGVVFTGVLPKPRKSLDSFRYYIEVTDKALATNQTIQYAIAVVDSPRACKGKLLAGLLVSASVLLQGPPGVAGPPSGFASSGVVNVAEPATASVATAAPASARKTETKTTASGETVATAAPAATGNTGTASAGGAGRKHGGGVGATTLMLGGLAVAGGAVAVGASRRGNEGSMPTPGSPSASASPTPSTSQPAAWDLGFVPSLDVTLCAAGPTVFSSQRVTTDANGSFDTYWTHALHVVGQAQPTVFQATLTCLAGSMSGAISAPASPNGYSGTFRFGTQQGQVTITRGQ